MAYIVKGRLLPDIIEKVPYVAESRLPVADQLSALVEVAQKLGLPDAARVIKRQARKRQPRRA